MKRSRLATAIALGVSLLVASLDIQIVAAAEIRLLPFDSRIELLTEPHAGVTYLKLNGPKSPAIDVLAADEDKLLSVSECQDLIQQLFVWQSVGVAHNIIGNESHFSPLAAVEKYIEKAKTPFRTQTGKELTGVPFLFNLKLRVTPDGVNSKPISKKIVSEISQDDVEYAVAWVMSQYPTSGSPGNARRKLVRLEPTLSTQPLVDLSRGIRAYRRKQVASLFKSRLRNAILKLETSLQEQTNAYIRKKRFPSRSWRTERGKPLVVGQFESLFAGRVRIRLFNGFQMLDLADLSPDDRAYVKQATKSTISNSEQLKLQREARLALVAKGLVDFRSLEKPLKPLGLVTDGGKLALSWRVMILPSLGGGDLFELFRLDEPWNSEHNLKLLSYVPPIYKLDASQSEGTAAIVRFTGIGTASSPTRLVTQEEITYPGKTLLATLVKPEHAVPWTKPQDLLASSSGISQEIMLFDGKALVVNCDGSLHWLKEGFSDKQLSRAAVRLR